MFRTNFDPMMTPSSDAGRTPVVNKTKFSQLSYKSCPATCKKCGGKYADLEPFARQRALKEEFGSIPSECVPLSVGLWECPMHGRN